MSLKNLWPSEEELNKTGGEVYLAPYGVISQYSEAVYEQYSKKLIGIVLLRSKIKDNGDRTEFVYSLAISQAKNDGAQIKIFEFDVEDDGWYPVKVFLTKPYREEIGEAETEKQLRTFIENGIKSNFVKTQIKSLLQSH
jgi:hypothetical protein